MSWLDEVFLVIVLLVPIVVMAEGSVETDEPKDPSETGTSSFESILKDLRDSGEPLCFNGIVQVTEGKVTISDSYQLAKCQFEAPHCFVYAQATQSGDYGVAYFRCMRQADILDPAKFPCVDDRDFEICAFPADVFGQLEEFGSIMDDSIITEFFQALEPERLYFEAHYKRQKHTTKLPPIEFPSAPDWPTVLSFGCLLVFVSSGLAFCCRGTRMPTVETERKKSIEKLASKRKTQRKMSYLASFTIETDAKKSDSDHVLKTNEKMFVLAKDARQKKEKERNRTTTKFKYLASFDPIELESATKTTEPKMKPNRKKPKGANKKSTETTISERTFSPGHGFSLITTPTITTSDPDMVKGESVPKTTEPNVKPNHKTKQKRPNKKFNSAKGTVSERTFSPGHGFSLMTTPTITASDPDVVKGQRVKKKKAGGRKPTKSRQKRSAKRKRTSRRKKRAETSSYTSEEERTVREPADPERTGLSTSELKSETHADDGTTTTTLACTDSVSVEPENAKFASNTDLLASFTGSIRDWR